MRVMSREVYPPRTVSVALRGVGEERGSGDFSRSMGHLLLRRFDWQCGAST